MPFGVACQAWYTTPSKPVAKISRRPSALATTDGRLLHTESNGCHPLQLHAPASVVRSHSPGAVDQVRLVRALAVTGFDAEMLTG